MATITAPVVVHGKTGVFGAPYSHRACPHRAYPHRAVSRDGDMETTIDGEVPTISSASPDMFGASPGLRSPKLHRAARWGDLFRVTQLLDDNTVDVNEGDANGSTALMWCSQSGHDECVKLLLANNANPNIRNKFNWSALEYASTSSLAGDVLPVLLDSLSSTTITNCPYDNEKKIIPAVFFGDAYGALLTDYKNENKFAKSGGPAGSVARLVSICRNTVQRYTQSATQSTIDMKTQYKNISNGGVAIAGCTCKPLGLYAGQRYAVSKLFWRRQVGVGDEERVEAFGMDDKAPGDKTNWTLCATLSNPTWTPWGSIEVDVQSAELRSVRDELLWAMSVTVSFAAVGLIAFIFIKSGVLGISSVNSNSMAPTVLKGDSLLVDRRKQVICDTNTGDVVLFAPPVKLITQIQNTRGSARKKDEFFVKRLVAVEGDVIEIEGGVLTRNGVRETGYLTGTPVGVVEVINSIGEVNSNVNSRERELPANCPTICKFASYSLKPTTVPPGFVFVLGDNRGASVDGHVWGYLPTENIKGKITTRILPVDRAGKLGGGS